MKRFEAVRQVAWGSASKLFPFRTASSRGQKPRIQFSEFEGGWKEVQLKTNGYGTETIANTIKEASRKVRDGISAYERDGVTFSKVQYSWPVLSGLLLAASEAPSELRVVDFGGSLGTTYFQNQRYLSKLRSVTWAVVEQPNLVAIGREEFATAQLTFHSDFDAACAVTEPSVIHFGSSLQYVEDPRLLLSLAAGSGASHLIIDRTPLHSGPEDILSLQSVPENIYDGQYPAWIFSRDKLFHDLSTEWVLLEEFASIGGTKQTDRGTFFDWSGAHFFRK